MDSATLATGCTIFRGHLPAFRSVIRVLSRHSPSSREALSLALHVVRHEPSPPGKAYTGIV